MVKVVVEHRGKDQNVTASSSSFIIFFSQSSFSHFFSPYTFSFLSLFFHFPVSFLSYTLLFLFLFHFLLHLFFFDALSCDITSRTRFLKSVYHLLVSFVRAISEKT